MATLNKTTWQSKFADFINRVAPFDAQPLIQKSEHLTVVGTDLGDSVIFKDGTSAAITSPSASFNADFATGDQININTSGSVDTAFTVTIQNLNTNETGVLNVTKKSGDTIAFANAVIAPFNSTEGQTGKTALKFFVKKISSDYVAIIGYDAKVPFANLATDAKPTYGTFTPGIAFGGGTTGITYGTRTGVAIQTILSDGKIKVDFEGYLQVTNLGSSTGSMTITGFPLTANSSNAVCNILAQRINLPVPGGGNDGFILSNRPLGLKMITSTTTAALFDRQEDDPVTKEDVQIGLTDLEFWFSGTYIHTP
jgi:hypothetical protein